MRAIIQSECQNYYQRTFSELQSFCFLLNKQYSTQRWQNKRQVNVIHCEGRDTSGVIYPLGILMTSEMNYTHPQKKKKINGNKTLEYLHQKKKKPTNYSLVTK